MKKKVAEFVRIREAIATEFSRIRLPGRAKKPSVLAAARTVLVEIFAVAKISGRTI
jgi:hypothetical protein